MQWKSRVARHDYAPALPSNNCAKLHELPPHTLRYYRSQDLGILSTQHLCFDTRPGRFREHEKDLSWTVSVTISVPVQKENAVSGRTYLVEEKLDYPSAS